VFVFQFWASDGSCWLESQGTDRNDTPPSPLSGDVAEKWRMFPPGDDHSITHPGAIGAGDYTEIEKGFGPGPCDYCGKKWVNYQKAVWYDPDIETVICEIWYQNLPRSKGTSREVASNGCTF
jgi:hypothetical protein